jgi:hypothetical protein
MAPQELPPVVLAFLAEHIGNLEQFQLLLRLTQFPDRWWDASTVVREVGLGPHEAQQALDHFARHNLLDIRITGDVRYQFRPGTEALHAAALAAADAFRQHPLAVVDAISGGSRRSIRDFADAFRIRRDDHR